MKKIVVIVFVIILLIIGGILLFNTNIEVEYVPESEIKDVDLRKTMVTLYFRNKESKEIEKETRLIDSKDLLLEPYSKLLSMLVEGPQTDTLEKTIPDNAKLLKVELEGDVLKIYFSKEFETDNKENCIFAISSTMKELNEVRDVEVLIEDIEISENI